MSKFYIQCGAFEFLTGGDDARSAALWAIHRYLGDRVELDSINWNDPATIDRLDMVRAMLDLGDEIVVSEIGFGRDDAGRLDTADILTEWNQLIVAVLRLESSLADWD